MNPTNCSRFAAAIASAFALLALNAPAVAQPYGSGVGYGATAPVLQPLTTDETKSLRYMREEEKLARDVYKVLLDKWKLAVFQNVMTSEDTHFNAMGSLLARYGVSDPAMAAPGVYADPALNTLYSELVGRGLQSVQDALAVGVVIEKQDIADLEKATAATGKYDIKRVFHNLMSASYNHLEAFETVCAIAAPVN